ncbi:glycosyltransferase involved in cell wall biosynthesis [Gillisia sp. Hel_I_86]|uniref:glycosyltransferase family 4 protein n=1 Tax=Gillisia sp. Hel_I_86 TaxID=1249981 RepID=UPI00119B6F15|nr:glycosyltransferase family 4 protein [Gillisia sp. Hel_I_86]TVZ25589.1 glycosyltransferase involved in cell wall biosynthesis [Gillisia sp. Hel_I_86]
MHLGFLTSEYPHPKTNPAAGIGTSIKNMVTALVEKGVKVSLFIYGQTRDEVFIEDGIKFHLIKQQKYMFLGWYLHRKFLQHYLNKAIVQDKIGAIEAPDWTGITAFMNLKCPLVIRMNGSDTYFCHLENRAQKKKNFWFEKKAFTGANHLLSVSEFTAKKTTELFSLKKEIEVIPNSVDINYFKPNNTEIEPNTILYFGSIIRKKGILELAEIFNLIVEAKPTARLLFAGKDVKDHFTGSSTKQLILDKLSPVAKKNTASLGVLPYEKVLTQIGKAQVIVLPSFAEALPMTWIEAMAMEKAMVTSNIGWAKEVMIDGITGFTVDPKEHQEYARKVLQLLENPKLAKEMGKSARQQVVAKFSTQVVVERNIEFYKSVIKKS